MKAGVIGLGYMGKNHARVYRELGLDVIGFDSDPNAYKDKDIPFVERAHHIPDLLARANLVSVCVPTTGHRHAAVEAIERAGAPLLIEKPVAESVYSAQKIRAAAQKHGTPVAVGFGERYNPSIKELVSRIGKEEQIHRMDFQRLNPYPPRIKDVGVIVDMSVHDIDLCGFISGEKPWKVFAHTRSKELPTKKFEDTATINLIYDDFDAAVHSDWLTPTRIRKATVHTSRAYYTADLLDGGRVEEYDRYAPKNGATADTNTTSMKIHTPRRSEALKSELSAFIEFAKTGKPGQLATLDQGIDVLQIAEAATRSAAKGEPIEISWE